MSHLVPLVSTESFSGFLEMRKLLGLLCLSLVPPLTFLSLSHWTTESSRVPSSPKEGDQSVRYLSISEMQKSTPTGKSGNGLARDAVPWGQF